MRANVHEYELIAPATLAEVLAVLAEGKHVPIAGGTELMVALAAGRLPRTPLLSISHLRELRFIEATSDAVIIGSGTTFTDLRKSEVVSRALPLLSQAASWTGSIANQNRGTLGGNVVNASPAADSAPALLVYDAEIIMISSGGERSLPYRDFHLEYKRTALRTGELVHSFRIPTPPVRAMQLIRKVGARNAQAISKIALAALGLVECGIVTEIRLAAASLREMPWRLGAVEDAVRGRPLEEATIAAARAAVLAEARAIDDIRSTAAYRSAVAANLVADFLRSLVGENAGRSGEGE